MTFYRNEDEARRDIDRAKEMLAEARRSGELGGTPSHLQRVLVLMPRPEQWLCYGVIWLNQFPDYRDAVPIDEPRFCTPHAPLGPTGAHYWAEWFLRAVRWLSLECGFRFTRIVVTDDGEPRIARTDITEDDSISAWAFERIIGQSMVDPSHALRVCLEACAVCPKLPREAFRQAHSELLQAIYEAEHSSDLAPENEKLTKFMLEALHSVGYTVKWKEKPKWLEKWKRPERG